jgi:hypothetical protein
VFYEGDDGSSSGSYATTNHPNSLLPTIEEGFESEGESAPLHLLEDEADNSPFCQKVESVMMATLTPANKDARLDDRTPPPASTANPAIIPEDPATRIDKDLEQRHKQADDLINTRLNPRSIEELREM